MGHFRKILCTVTRNGRGSMGRMERRSRRLLRLRVVSSAGVAVVVGYKPDYHVERGDGADIDGVLLVIHGVRPCVLSRSPPVCFVPTLSPIRSYKTYNDQLKVLSLVRIRLR